MATKVRGGQGGLASRTTARRDSETGLLPNARPRAWRPAPVDRPATVLIALCGLSPAVITETVWALAHEKPTPVLPQRIVVLTTGKGREAIRRELLAGGAWDRLRQDLAAPSDVLLFGDTGDSIRTFVTSDAKADLEDIVSAEDSVAVGDFILAKLREFTEDPGVRVLFSLAGGRKTMTALGALAMTLLARAGDRLCHVLVSPPFDEPRLAPRFYFPNHSHTHRLGEATYRAVEARIVLHDIPFIRARDVFQREYKRLPGSFRDTVALANSALAAVCPQPQILLTPKTRTCRINDVAVDLTTAEFVLFWFLCDQARHRAEPILGQDGLSRALAEFETGITTTVMPAKLHWDSKRLEDNNHVRKLVNRLRASLREAVGVSPCWPRLDPAPERGHYGIRVAPDAITIEDG